MSNFVVYKSSAGSGKTFTLVKEYLRLALHDEKKLNWNFKRILAVTFTNKAAAEMKQRVIDALDKIIHKDPMPEPGALLCQELKITAATLKDRSRILLQAILHNYSDLAIGTIDSFTHKIVKTFAHDLDLPVNFTLETDVDGFYGEVIAELLSKIGEDKEITKLLKEYSLGKTEENASWDPEKNLLEFVKLLQKENATWFLEKLKKFTSEDLEKFRVDFSNYSKAYKKHLSELSNEALELLKKNNIEDEDLWNGKNSPVNFFRKCARAEISLEEITKPNLQKVIQKNNWIKDPSHPAAGANSRLSAIASELIAYIEKNHSHFVLAQLVGKQIYQLMLVKKIEEISDQKKEEEQIVFISEFNQRIFELINNEPTPFIYERLGERYRHYLLDEFQDTSALQWQNILPLLDNSLANGWFNLLVGDGKQSIYRWRNADVKQFANLPDLAQVSGLVAAERALSLKRNFLEKKLDVNYRSSKTIVEFNNELFDALSASILAEPYSRIYSGQAQKIKSDDEGYVSVLTGKTAKENYEELHCEKAAEYIAEALASGYNFGDICIITRYKAEGAAMASYLVQKNVPVVSSESLLLKNNAGVHALVSFLNYLNNPEDMVTAASVLSYLNLAGKMDAEKLDVALKFLKEKDLFEILTLNGIAFNKNDFPLKNIFDNCIQICELLGLNLSHPIYMRFFLDEVNEFLVTRNSNLSQFLFWWESRQNKASVILQENSNAVRIMTIHGSKGLEFPVVIIPFCNWPLYKADNTWVKLDENKTSLPVAVVKLSEKVSEAGLHEELSTEQMEQALDNLNLLYVAFTRAIERLQIICTKSETNRLKPVSQWMEDYLRQKFGEKDLYEFGQKLKVQRITGKKLQEIILKPLQFNLHPDNIRIKASWTNNPENEKAKTAGIQLHRIMSEINAAEDIDSALENALLQGYATQNELPELKEKISKIILHPLLKDCFQNDENNKLEAELITTEGEILRPDKISFRKEKTIIIDYKTGSENKSKYEKQMLKYELALKEMGYPNIQKMIAYVDRGEIVVI